MNADALSIEARCARIRFLVLDVDGVLTDGGLYYDANGLAMKRFDVQDGLGIRMLKKVGVEVGVITGMDTPCVLRRMEALGISLYHGGWNNKARELDKMRQQLGLAWEEVGYLGDDWVDLAPMSLVGFPAAVPNAREDVRARAVYITQRAGGHGAVRELAEKILSAKGLKDTLLEEWTRIE